MARVKVPGRSRKGAFGRLGLGGGGGGEEEDKIQPQILQLSSVPPIAEIKTQGQMSLYWGTGSMKPAS